MSIEIGTFGENAAQLGQEALARGDVGLYLACLQILMHISPDLAKKALRTGADQILGGP